MYRSDTQPSKRPTSRQAEALNPTTEAEFTAALETLVQSARSNDVDVEGSWPYRYDGPRPDYEVRIERFAKPLSTSPCD